MMTAALGRVRTVEVTNAVRSAQVNGITVEQDKPIALVDGELVAAGQDMDSLLLKVLNDTGAPNSEIITLYYGSDVSAAAAQEMRARLMHKFPEQEIELHEGGQPLYPYIISIE